MYRAIKCSIQSSKRPPNCGESIREDGAPSESKVIVVIQFGFSFSFRTIEPVGLFFFPSKCAYHRPVDRQHADKYLQTAAAAAAAAIT